MRTKEKTNAVVGSGDRFTGKMFKKLWIPAIISSFSWALSDIADAVVVGNKLGALGLAAIGLILPVYMFNAMMAHGFGVGGSVRYAALLGAGKSREASSNFFSVSAVGLICSGLTALLGLLFLKPLLALLGTTPADGALFYSTRDYLSILLLSSPLYYMSNILNYYLRNDSCEKLAGIGSVAGNLSDIVLNIILVIGFNLGTRGAALSTTAGQIIAIAVYLPGVFSKSHNMRPRKPLGNFIKQGFGSLRAGLGTSIQYFYQVIFFLLCNNILIKMSGEVGVATFDVIQNASYLILYLFEGTSRAVQPLLSTYCGEHNKAGRRNASKYAFVSGAVVGGAVIAFIAIFPNAICTLFGISEITVATEAMRALRIYCLGAMFAGVNIFIGNYYQSCECAGPAFAITTLRGSVLLIAFTILFSTIGHGIFWWLYPATEVSTLIVFLILRKIRKYSVPDVSEERIYQYTAIAETSNLIDVSQQIGDFCEKWDANPKQQYFLTMTVEELGMAILLYGIRDQEDGYIQFTVIADEDGKFELHIRDNADNFNPFSLDGGKDGAEINEEGLGVNVVKKKAEIFFYQRFHGFNSLVVKI